MCKSNPAMYRIRNKRPARMQFFYAAWVRGMGPALALVLALAAFSPAARAHQWRDADGRRHGFHDRDGYHHDAFGGDFHDGYHHDGYHDGYGPGRYGRFSRLRQRADEVQAVRDNPSAFGARVKYLRDDWNLKYIVWAPDGFNKQKNRPLLISLHGNDEGAEDAFARLYHTARRFHYALVAPRWGGGDQFMTPEELSDFISVILQALPPRDGVAADPSMVILHGYERGANMAGFLGYLTPDRYVLCVVDSGPFPEIGAPAPGRALAIPGHGPKMLAGRYIYLYARYEDQALYNRLNQSRAALSAAGVHAALNYTKGLNAGEFNDTLSESIVKMFDQAAGIK